MQEYQHKDSLVLKGGTGSVIKLCSPPETREGCRGGRMDLPWWGKTAKCRAQHWMPTSSSFLLQLWHWPFPVMFSKPFSLLLSNLYLPTVYRLLHQNISLHCLGLCSCTEKSEKCHFCKDLEHVISFKNEQQWGEQWWWVLYVLTLWRAELLQFFVLFIWFVT